MKSCFSHRIGHMVPWRHVTLGSRAGFLRDDFAAATSRRMTRRGVSTCALLLGILAAIFCPGTSAFAQQDQPAPGPRLEAVIISPDDVAVGRRIILDASASRLVGNNVQYFWYVNGQQDPISKTVDAIFTPEGPGTIAFKLTIRTVVDGQPREASVARVVTVYKRKIVLVADGHVTPDQLAALQRSAASGSVYLRVLRAPVPATDRTGEDRLSSLLSEQSAALFDAETIVLWTDGVPAPGLQALLKAEQSDPKYPGSMEQQTLVLITDLSLSSVGRIAQGPLSVLKPRKLLVTRPSTLPLLLAAPDADGYVRMVKQAEQAEPLILDASTVEISPWFFLTLLINEMLTLGVSSQTVLLLLVLPVIATILSFLRQVVGMSTFGLFTPSIIALSFLVLGWWIGVLFLLFILATGYLSRSMMRRWHILYIPKMAIILGIGSILLLLLVAIATAFGVLLSHDTVFVLLIMSTLVESFLNVKSEQGLRSALLAIGQTVLAALLCVLLVQWSPFRLLILAYPEIILLTILVNILIGRWTGLRITEYFRFRELFKHLREEE